MRWLLTILVTLVVVVCSGAVVGVGVEAVTPNDVALVVAMYFGAAISGSLTFWLFTRRVGLAILVGGALPPALYVTFLLLVLALIHLTCEPNECFS
jgi:hypothetical protein